MTDFATMRADVMRILKDVPPEVRNQVAEAIDRHAGARPNTPPAPVRPNTPPAPVRPHAGDPPRDPPQRPFQG